MYDAMNTTNKKGAAGIIVAAVIIATEHERRESEHASFLAFRATCLSVIAGMQPFTGVSTD